MPGIAGVIRRDRAEENEALVTRMVRRMSHDPSYRSGAHAENRMGLAAGWACHPGSFSDCLPVWNDAKDVCLFFSGENFADRAEMERLVGRGRPVDVETAKGLVHLYEEQGEAFVGMLNGCFSGLLVDLRAGRSILFNDRYGLGRVYCHEARDGFYFASEAKALLEVLPSLRRLDAAGLGEFFACGCAMQNRSLFQGVSLLPPASAWVFDRGGAVTKRRYFEKETWESQPALPAPEYYERLKAAFARVLPRYFGGRQDVALSLTGGLDSRLILSWAPRAPFTLPCYTFGGMYRECADVRVARRVAKACRQNHEVIRMDRRFFAEFPALADECVYFTDGAMEVVGAAGLFLHRLARGVAPVRLTGNYGDEVLRGNVAFKPGSPDEALFDGDFKPNLLAAREVYEQERKGLRASFIAFKQVPWHHFARLGMEQTQLTVRTPYLDNELVALAYQAPGGLDVNRGLAHRLIVDGNPALEGMATDRGGLRRLKFLPFRVREFCQEFMPRAEYVYDYGMPQWLARADHRLARLHLERLFLGAQKYAHFRVWYRDELASFVQEVLLDPRCLSRPYLCRKTVEKMVGAHVKGVGNYTLQISKLLTSEIVQRRLIEGP